MISSVVGKVTRYPAEIENMMMIGNRLTLHCCAKIICLLRSQIFVVVRDINDEAPYFITDGGCATITEYHKLHDTITIIKANDKDDVNTGNGQLLFSLVGEKTGLFTIASIDMKTAKIATKAPLIGRFGNYSLMVKAVDRGHPPQQSMQSYDVCVIDVNDNTPVFVSPPQNITIRIPEVCFCFPFNFLRFIMTYLTF